MTLSELRSTWRSLVERLAARPFRRIGQEEFGRGHAERVEQILFLELIERLAGGYFDHAAEHIGRMPVIPHRARLFGQRPLRDPFGESGIVEIAEIDARIGGLDQSLRPGSRCDAGQAARRSAMLAARAPAPGSSTGLPDSILASRRRLCLSAKDGMYLLTGSSSGDLAAIPRQHRRHAGDGLGHRMNRKDRIQRQRCAVAATVAF